MVSPYEVEFVAQIVNIKIQKAFLLNEVAEHKPIEHYRCIPLLVAVVLGINMVVDARYKLCKCLVLLFEAGIEILCDFFGVDSECCLHLRAQVNDIGLLVKVESDSVYLLIEHLGIGIIIFNKNKVAFLVGADRHNPKVMGRTSLTIDANVVESLTSKFGVNLLCYTLSGYFIDF